MKTLHDIIKTHPFFEGFSEEEIKTISTCGKNQVFQPNEYLAQENNPADVFYLIRTGFVQIDMNIPNQSSKVIQTVGNNEIFGWSWLFEPYRWAFNAKALEITHTITLDGKCLRNKLEHDPKLGFKLMKRFSKLFIERLKMTRLQLLDIYGKQG